jgi:hypothetical protein
VSEKTLLHEIVNCPHAKKCLVGNGTENPCHPIVNSQGHQPEQFQVPEPWSGQIERAPILFLSSNPSIGDEEVYPTWAWSDSDVHDYFNHRFGGGHQNWIIDGTKSLKKDGEYSHAVRFWAAVRQRAIELLPGKDVKPGIDYALTEIVHCKSKGEIGVKEAQSQCVETYLMRILELSAAKVIVVLGSNAKQAIQRQFPGQFPICEQILVSEAIEIGGHERIFAFLPHPNARQPRSFSKCLPNELEKLRAYLG